jgi:hypothetical protein
MQSKHLNVSHVLMAVDPSAAHWQTAVNLAQSLSEHGVKTTFACITAPSPGERFQAAKVPDVDIRTGPGADTLEWMLFLEMLVSPDLVQVFDPQHGLLPWRSPIVLHIPDSVLLSPTKALFEATSTANLIVVEDEARFDKLQALVGVGPFVAVLRSDEDCGWNYFLAYQEIVQGLNLDLGDEPVGRFELI